MGEELKCEASMSCGVGSGDGIKCIWDAGKKGCKKWCRAHADKWVPNLLIALDRFRDDKASMLLTIDKLMFENKRGAFIRGSKQDIPKLLRDCAQQGVGDPNSKMMATQRTDIEPKTIQYTKEDELAIQEEIKATETQLSPARIEFAEAKLTVCGLAGNPPEDVVSDWETQFTHMDLLEFCNFRGYPKRVISLNRGASGEYILRYPNGETRSVDKKTAITVIATALSEPYIKGTRLLFEFKLGMGGMDKNESLALMRSLETKDPSGELMFKSVNNSGNRSYMIEPKVTGGGAQLSLDCGTFVAHWHTLGYLVLTLPTAGLATSNRTSADLVMTW